MLLKKYLELNSKQYQHLKQNCIKAYTILKVHVYSINTEASTLFILTVNNKHVIISNNLDGYSINL